MEVVTQKDLQKLHQLAFKSLLKLATSEGINASGKEEIFGCIFGRDSALTILKMLRVHQKKPTPSLLDVCRRALLTLIKLQGRQFNLQSGEQPGKFIHEFRKSNYDHLVNNETPWFVYPDGILRNYDSIDSTPLILIAIFKYWQTSTDDKFLITVLPAVEAALNWIISYGDRDRDKFLEYDFPKARKFGGLSVQSWTDSHESIKNRSGKMPKYPIAPIEVQAFAWLALKLWSDFYLLQSPKFAKKLLSCADDLKQQFNDRFILRDQALYFGAQALDGDKNQIKTITANPMLCLWAAYYKYGEAQSILEPRFLKDFVKRIFKPDLFVEGAGIRTMSSLSPTFNPNQDSYHNGSFWPILNGLIVEGLENFGFTKEAQKLTNAALLPLSHFGYPIELYIKKNAKYLEYQAPSGQTSCHYQAWSAAALLDMTTT